jgi:hypothetical protein
LSGTNYSGARSDPGTWSGGRERRKNGRLSLFKEKRIKIGKHDEGMMKE